MTPALLVVFLGAVGSVPSPAAALLESTSFHHYTRLLLAQAEDFGPGANLLPPDERAAEAAQLADDTETAREHLGPDAGATGATTGSAVTEPDDMEALEAEIRAWRHLGHAEEEPPRSGYHNDDDDDYGDRDIYDDEEPPRRRRYRRMHELRRASFGYRGPTHDGHGKAYYLVWGIVDWTVAGGIWSASLYHTLFSFSYWGLATKTGPLTLRERYPSWVDPRSTGLRKSHYRTAAIVNTVLAVLFAAGGGFFAWRATPNLRTYGELHEQQERELRSYRGRARRRWRGPPRWQMESEPPAPESGAESLRERRHTLEGTWDRYSEPEAPGAEPHPELGPTPEEVELPGTKYRKGDPKWKEYLEKVRRRVRQHREDLDAEEDDHDHDARQRDE